MMFTINYYLCVTTQPEGFVFHRIGFSPALVGLFLLTINHLKNIY